MAIVILSCNERAVPEPAAGIGMVLRLVLPSPSPYGFVFGTCIERATR